MPSKKNRVTEPGSITTFHWDGHRLFFSTNTVNGKVVVYRDGIIRVVLSREKEPSDFSYAVVAQPDSPFAQFEELATELKIHTNQVITTIEKNTARISFHNSEGQLLNEDEPGLGTSWLGEQVTIYKKLQPGERFIGLGEKTGPLDRKGRAYQNWNTDAYSYHGGTDPLYCSMPFYIGLHQQRLYGIYLDNTHKSHFNFGASNNRFASFSADAGDMNYYFFAGDSVASLIEQYTWLTGRMELPPLWSIGYQQCRYSYYPDKELFALARTFREKDIPADGIVLDIHYMDKYKIFTWDRQHFSNPKQLIESLQSAGFQVVLMCDPGIKAEPGYATYDDGIREDVFVKYADGQPYTGQVWPGWCHFPDFTNPKTREWWKTQLKAYTDLDVRGYWNDMNEIATWGNALPENLLFDFDGEGATTRGARNVYGFQMARSTYQATKQLMNNHRPFNLTRSAFSGVQRYSAVWTGDNVSYDDHMLLGVRLVNSLGLAGVAFAGYDAGGFVGDANPKLFARWISIAALSPFFRAHTMINTRDSEPWSYGEEVEQIARNFIKFRYQLMPYIYSLFYEATRTGMPVQRSLAIEFPFTDKVYDHAYHNQYLFGPALLVAPVESSRDILKVYLPQGSWYYLYDGKRWEGGQEIYLETPIHKLPVFVRGGSVIPMKKAGINTESQKEELYLHVYPGAESTSFELYQDDGDGYEYQVGKRSVRCIRYIPSENRVLIEAQQGSFDSPVRVLTMVFHHLSTVREVRSNGQPTPFNHREFSFFSPLEKYDPINDPESMASEWVVMAPVNYTTGEMNIMWSV